MSYLLRQIVGGFLALVILAVPSPAHADSWVPAKVEEYSSSNGQFTFTVTPRNEKVPCKGELFRLVAGKRESIWTRELLNYNSPVSATVSDSGEYVITFDDWGRCGMLPIVIYGKDGAFKHAFDLDDLGIFPNSDPVRVSVSSVWWRSGALIFTGTPIKEWGENSELLFVRLSWGRWLVIMLQSAEFLRLAPERKDDLDGSQRKQVLAYMKEQTSKMIMETLNSKDEESVANGCTLAAEEAIDQALPKIEAFKARIAKMDRSETRDRYLKTAEVAIARLKGEGWKEVTDTARKVHESRLEALRRAYETAVDEENEQFRWQQATARKTRR